MDRETFPLPYTCNFWDGASYGRFRTSGAVRHRHSLDFPGVSSVVKEGRRCISPSETRRLVKVILHIASCQECLGKFKEEICLMNQTFVKDPSKTVSQLLTEMIAKIGENMNIRRFARYALGEGIQKSADETLN